VKPLIFDLVLAGLLLVTAGVSTVLACDSASCALVTRGQNGVATKGGGRIDLSFRYVDDGTGLLGREPIGEVVRPKVDFENGGLRPGYHRETGGREAFLQLDGTYGLSARLTLVATVPVINHRSYDHLHPAGSSTAGFAAVPFTSEGFGDIWAGARYALTSHVVAGASIKAPTGSYREHGGFDGTIDDPMLQPGTGSWDVLASLLGQARVAGVDGSLSGSYMRAGNNGLDYRFGDEAIVAMGAARHATHNLVASVQLKAHRRGRSEYQSSGVPSTGETSAHIVPGLRLDNADHTSVYVFVQVPLYRRVNEQQLATRASVLIGVAKAF
jgi:hypothetical protein